MKTNQIFVILMFLLNVSILSQENIEKDKQLVNSLSGKEKITKLNEIAAYYDNIGEYETSLIYFNQSLKIALARNDIEEIGRGYYNLGRIFDTKGDYKLSLKYYELAIAYYSKINYKKGIAEGLTGKSTILRLSGKYNEAYSELLKAQSISNELKDSTLITFVQYRLGIFYGKVKSYDKSHAIFAALLKYSKEKNLLKRMSACYTYLGFILFTKGNYDSSIVYFDQALEIRTKLKDWAGVATTLNNIGDAEYERGNYNVALLKYTLSDSIRSKIKIKYGVAETQKNIGKIFVKLNLPIKAINYLKNSVKIAKEGDLPEILKTDYFYLSAAYRQLKDSKNALLYLDYYTALNDSISVDEFNRQLSNVKYQYEIDKQNAEIIRLKNEQLLESKNNKYEKIVYSAVVLFILALLLIIIYRYRLLNKTKTLLEEKNNEILMQQAELKKLNEDKDKLIRIIAHDLKNPFHNVIGLSDILIEDYNDLSKDEIIDYLYGINSTAKSTYLLLENLLQWTKNRLNKVDSSREMVIIKEIVNQTIELSKLTANNKNITITNKIEENIPFVTNYNYLYTILRNLISNSIKFTDHGGSIIVSSAKVADGLRISVCDNGIGMSEKTQSDLFSPNVISQAGTENEKGTGLGLSLCNELLGKLNSGLEVNSEIGKGSTFSFTLKNYCENEN
ncbi:MAG: tetratricopeptide repeat-containing sensor histidine kinase [Bacteroidota bacterium]|nr:tetratricopeptide repeat-containing sensor histidine kinase [Bacteroidota bacterium]